MSQEAEIAEMLDALGSDGVAAGAEDAPAESEEEPSGDDTEEPEGEVEDGEEEEDGTDGEGEEEEDEEPEDGEEEVDEVAELRAVNKELLQQFNANISALLQAQTEAGSGKEKEAEPINFAEDFLTEEEQDNLIDHPELLNKAFARFADKLTQAFQKMQTDTSASVEASISATVAAQKTAESFYAANPDLNTPLLKGFVKTVFSQKAAEAKAAGLAKSNDKLLEDTAKAVRQALGLKKPKSVKKVASGKKKKPTMPGSKSGRKGKPKKDDKRTDQQTLMDELV